MEFEYNYNEAGGVGQFQELKAVSCYRGGEFGGVSSVAFDPQEDLLWAATYGGHVTSYYSSSLEKYTCFQAHHEDIRQLQPTVGGVVTITEDELKLSARNGLPSLVMRKEESLNKMNCVLYLDDTSLLVGCQTGVVTTVDLVCGQVSRETLTTNGVCLLKPSEHYICCGDVTGRVFMTDPISLQTVAAFPAHMAGMCDMDVVGNMLVTCGLTQQYGQLCVDTQLKVFDLRFLRPMSPCDVTMLQPFLLRCLPTVDSTILVLSQLGEFQLLDLRGLVTPSSMVVSRLNTSAEGVMACAVDVGTSCQCLAFGDSSGVVHLWADQEEVVMNPYAVQNIAFPDQADESLPFISWDSDDKDSAPLSAIPMSLASYGRTTMLNHWPAPCSKFTRRMAPTIETEVLENMRWSHFVGYAPKPSHIRHNQVPYDLERDLRDLVPESPMMRENNPLSLIPKPFRQVEIKYSKLGIETFDFGHYNETKFAGLEIHIPNAYCNCMLQVLYFMEPTRCIFLKHLCSKEFCLACELGLLFRMLDRSEGQSCQASNFLRAFRTLREASALGLLINWENEERKMNLGKLIQNWTRFVLQQLNQETDQQQQQGDSTPLLTTPTTATPTTPSFKSFAPKTPTTPMVQVGMRSFLSLDESSAAAPKASVPEEPVSVVQQLFGSTIETLVRCRCGWSTVTQRVELLFSLCYPHNSLTPHSSTEEKQQQESVPFSSVLQQSICRQQRMNSWCDKCGKYKSTTHHKSLCNLPSVLTLNCQVESEQDREFWQYQQQASGGNSPASPIPVRWIPFRLTLTLSAGNVLTVRQELGGEAAAGLQQEGGEGGAEGEGGEGGAEVEGGEGGAEVEGGEGGAEVEGGEGGTAEEEGAEVEEGVAEPEEGKEEVEVEEGGTALQQEGGVEVEQGSTVEEESLLEGGTADQDLVDEGGVQDAVTQGEEEGGAEGEEEGGAEGEEEGGAEGEEEGGAVGEEEGGAEGEEEGGAEGEEEGGAEGEEKGGAQGMEGGAQGEEEGGAQGEEQAGVGEQEGMTEGEVLGSGEVQADDTIGEAEGETGLDGGMVEDKVEANVKEAEPQQGTGGVAQSDQGKETSGETHKSTEEKEMSQDAILPEGSDSPVSGTGESPDALNTVSDVVTVAQVAESLSSEDLAATKDIMAQSTEAVSDIPLHTSEPAMDGESSSTSPSPEKTILPSEEESALEKESSPSVISERESGSEGAGNIEESTDIGGVAGEGTVSADNGGGMEEGAAGKATVPVEGTGRTADNARRGMEEGEAGEGEEGGEVEEEEQGEGEEEGVGEEEEGEGERRGGEVEEEVEGEGEEEGVGEEEEGEEEGGEEEVGEVTAEYELTMVVSHVKEPWMEAQGNLVAHIKVGPTYHQRKEGVEKTQWYLFNDFHITPIKESEVGVFPMEWLTPAILIYTKKDYDKPLNTDVSCQLDPIVLLTETHSPRPVQSPATFTPLAFGELPCVGDLVGIDAEFVTLNQEEAEVKSDGTHTTLKPSQFSVARITVIRGKGAMEGSCFVDDYIATSEQVVDYLTKFSGIKPGDLDASMSSKHLTTLKASYLKILYLLESGVKFVGHGLNKDFRVINILVPPDQIIDTVKLFHLPNQRYISLKFLAWFFLNMHIQKEAHDSCEDACSALLLYRKYQELKGKGRVAEMLKSLYETGRGCNWKVPES